LIPTIEDWAICDLQGYIFLSGNVVDSPSLPDGCVVSTALLESARRADDKLIVRCTTGQEYYIGQISDAYCAKYTTAYARLNNLVGKEKS
jgi:hypothetical protein